MKYLYDAKPYFQSPSKILPVDVNIHFEHGRCRNEFTLLGKNNNNTLTSTLEAKHVPNLALRKRCYNVLKACHPYLKDALVLPQNF